jgi:hypothetical protein
MVRNVNQFHPKIIYYDEHERQITSKLGGLTKIDPTKDEVNIKNTTASLISYDPLWIAYANKDNETEENNNNGSSGYFRTTSIPMSPIVKALT